MCLLKLMFKVPILLMLLVISSGGKLQAQETQTNVVNKSNMRVQNCPESFYSLPLYPNTKFCQLFAEKLPASMSYFATSDQQTMRAFYIEKLGQAEDEKTLHGRIVLQYSNTQKVLVISQDGQGSQVDILIKSTD